MRPTEIRWLSQDTQHRGPFTEVSNMAVETRNTLYWNPEIFFQIKLIQPDSTEPMRKSLLMRIKLFLQGLAQMWVSFVKNFWSFQPEPIFWSIGWSVVFTQFSLGLLVYSYKTYKKQFCTRNKFLCYVAGFWEGWLGLSLSVEDGEFAQTKSKWNCIPSKEKGLQGLCVPWTSW